MKLDKATQIRLHEDDVDSVIDELKRQAMRGERLDFSELERKLKQMPDIVEQEEMHQCMVCPGEGRPEGSIVLNVSGYQIRDKVNGEVIEDVQYGASGAKNYFICDHCFEERQRLDADGRMLKRQQIEVAK